MRLFLLTALTMTAFAANSVLNRLALDSGGIGPAGFTAVRLLSGAAMLALLMLTTSRDRTWLRAGSWVSALALFGYAAAFSFSYISLPAGTGALILFGCVQMTMFGWALWAGERPHVLRWAGSAIGLAGLVVLVLPGVSAPDPAGAALMAVAGVAWAIYSLRGHSGTTPLVSTSVNFLRALPFVAALWLATPAEPLPGLLGFSYAVISGAVTSALGYALWYRVLPGLGRSLAAIAQLSVPVIALAGGMVFLGEPLTPRFVLAALLVLGGIGMAVVRRPATRQTLTSGR